MLRLVVLFSALTLLYIEFPTFGQELIPDEDEYVYKWDLATTEQVRGVAKPVTKKDYKCLQIESPIELLDTWVMTNFQITCWVLSEKDSVGIIFRRIRGAEIARPNAPPGPLSYDAFYVSPSLEARYLHHPKGTSSELRESENLPERVVFNKGVWTKLRVGVGGRVAAIWVGEQKKPSLVVKTVSATTQFGSVGLYTDGKAYVRDVEIRREKPD